MKKVITYGTFDMLHRGHVRLLERAKALGDYLIVGVTSNSYDQYRGKLNVADSLATRLDNVRAAGIADEIIVEEYEGQKIDDILEKQVDVFAIGSDWVGEFDYLKEYCQVVYLERTSGISSTDLRDRSRGFIRFGVVGTGRIANRFIPETKYVSGISVDCAMDIDAKRAANFAARHGLACSGTSMEELFSKADALYIATPHQTHYEYTKQALAAGKHVLCEKPMALAKSQVTELFQLAKQQGVVLMEGLKTLHSNGFQRLVSLARSGRIGEIKSVDASFTKLVGEGVRELQDTEAGGSITELGSYPLLGIYKLLGLDYEDIRFVSYKKQGGVDLFTKCELVFPKAVASAKVGLGVKTEGEMVISGTRGYIYVPAPWWKTSYFEMRFEDPSKAQKFFFEFQGDGLRYELVSFLRQVTAGGPDPAQQACSEALAGVIETYRSGHNVTEIC